MAASVADETFPLQGGFCAACLVTSLLFAADTLLDEQSPRYFWKPIYALFSLLYASMALMTTQAGDLQPWPLLRRLTPSVMSWKRSAFGSMSVRKRQVIAVSACIFLNLCVGSRLPSTVVPHFWLSLGLVLATLNGMNLLCIYCRGLCSLAGAEKEEEAQGTLMAGSFCFQGGFCGACLVTSLLYAADTLLDEKGPRYFWKPIYAVHSLLLASMALMTIQECDLQPWPLLGRLTPRVMSWKRSAFGNLSARKAQVITMSVCFYISIGVESRLTSTGVQHIWMALGVVLVTLNGMNLLCICCYGLFCGCRSLMAASVTDETFPLQGGFCAACLVTSLLFAADALLDEQSPRCFWKPIYALFSLLFASVALMAIQEADLQPWPLLGRLTPLVMSWKRSAFGSMSVRKKQVIVMSACIFANLCVESRLPSTVVPLLWLSLGLVLTTLNGMNLFCICRRGLCSPAGAEKKEE